MKLLMEIWQEERKQAFALLLKEYLNFAISHLAG
jgi:hypothetical protein